MNDIEILQYALSHGIVDLATIREQSDMAKQKEVLEKHKYAIWYCESDSTWRTYLPDEKKGRKLVKAKRRESVIEKVVKFYSEDTGEQITLSQIFPDWLDFKLAHSRSSSYGKRISAEWKRFYLPQEEFIDKPLRDFTKVELDLWAHRMIKDFNMTKKQYYGMSVILRQCLDYAVECGYIEHNYFNDVKVNSRMFLRVKKKRSDTEVYTEQEARELIADMFRRYATDPTNTAPLAVVLVFETGLRIGELVALKMSDIDGDYIHVQRQEIRNYSKKNQYEMKFSGFTVVDYTKTDDGDREVYLTKTAKDIIAMANKQAIANGVKDPDPYIFYRGTKRVNHYAVQAFIKRGCEYIGITVKTCHKIRKTYISALIDSGLNIDEIRRLAGHSDERTTYNSYCYNRKTRTETEETITTALMYQQKVFNSIQTVSTGIQ